MNDTSQQILDILPESGAKLSGTQIKDQLGLRDLEYKEAKKELKKEGLVILGRGRSGTIALALEGAEGEAQKDQSVQQRASASLWAEVEKRISEFRCKCNIGPNMSYEELLDLEEGCKGSRQGGPGWVCEVLDYYRRQMYKHRQPYEYEKDD